jgi:sugar phosphate isomerase/epimerase
MKNSRRKFIQNASLAFMGASLQPSALWSNTNMLASKNLIGVQLYSVRADMLKNPMETLTALSKMGIEYVEHANYINRKCYGWTATEFKKVLGGLGLKMPSGHTVMDATHYDKSKKDFTDEWKRTVEDAAVMGQTYVISPSIDDNLRNTYDGLMQQLDIFNKSGELCKASGMKFGYHNHDFEFKEKLNGTLMYDLILQNTDPNLVVHQLDFGNMYGAGGRAAEWINKYPGRFQSLHIKDEMKAANGIGEMNDGYESTILGDGVVDPKSIALLAKKIGGAHHYIIEQESYQGKSPLDCVKINLERMKTWGI